MERHHQTLTEELEIENSRFSCSRSLEIKSSRECILVQCRVSGDVHTLPRTAQTGERIDWERKALLEMMGKMTEQLRRFPANRYVSSMKLSLNIHLFF